MRISLIAVGSMGDVRPLSMLGRELVKRGHDVSLYAFSALAPFAEDTGMAFHALPGDAALFIGSVIRPGANPLTYLRRMLSSLQGVIDPLLSAMYDAFLQADVVVCSFFGATPYAMADKAGVPLFQINYSPLEPTGQYCVPVMPSLPFGAACNRALYALAYRMIGRLERRVAHPWCEQNGITKRPAGSAPNYMLESGSVQVLYAFSEVVVPRPPDWSQAVHQLGFFTEEIVTFTPSDRLRAFLEDGERPVYIGFGSMNTGDADVLLRIVLRALSATGQRAVLSKGWGGISCGALPKHVYSIEEFVPHSWLFSQVSAVVHHGGAGTTSAGLLAGAPTLVIPFGSDQFFWGERVHAMGCGPAPLSRRHLTARRLAQRLNTLCNTPLYREKAQEAAALLARENGVQAAADCIVAAYQSKEITASGG